MVGARLSLPPKQELLRLEGFEEPWEMCVLNGKECMEDQTLADCGISKDNNTVTTVRKVLVAEGASLPPLAAPMESAPTPTPSLTHTHAHSLSLSPNPCSGQRAGWKIKTGGLDDSDTDEDDF